MKSGLSLTTAMEIDHLRSHFRLVVQAYLNVSLRVCIFEVNSVL